MNKLLTSITLSIFLFSTLYGKENVNPHALSMKEAGALHEQANKIRMTYVIHGKYLLVNMDEYYESFLDKDGQPGLRKVDEIVVNKSFSNTKYRQELVDYLLSNESTQIDSFDGSFSVFLFKEHEDNETVVLGYREGAEQIDLIKRIPGSDYYMIDDTDDSYLKAFYVQTNPLEMVDSKRKGQYVGIVDRCNGVIYEYTDSYSLAANPVAHRGDVYLLDEQGNIILISADEDFRIAKDERVWQNKENLDIIEIGVSYNHSFIKYRKDGKNIYRFFDSEFKHVISEEEDISDFRYIKTTKEGDEVVSKDEETEVVTSALVIKDDGVNISSSIRYWINKEKKDEAVFKVVNLAERETKDANVVKKIFSGLEKHGLLQDIYNGVIDKTCFEREDYEELIMELKSVLEVEDIRPYVSLEKKINELYEGENAGKKYKMVKPHSLMITNRMDGTKVPVHVYIAKDASREMPKPLVIYVHGGPNVHLEKQFDARFQFLANQGYTVVVPNTRGSTGYGEAYQNALLNNWGKNHVTDVIAVADYFKKHPFVDSENVFLTGHSFGGYTSMITSVHPEFADYFDGYVSIAGLSEVGQSCVEACENEDTDYDKEFCIESWVKRLGFKVTADYNSDPKNHEISALYHMEKLNKPMLVIHGKNDTAVLVNQSQQFHVAAQKLGKNCKYVEYDGQDHYFEGTEGFKQWHEPMLEFFEVVMEGKRVQQNVALLHK